MVKLVAESEASRWLIMLLVACWCCSSCWRHAAILVESFAGTVAAVAAVPVLTLQNVVKNKVSMLCAMQMLGFSLAACVSVAF